MVTRARGVVQVLLAVAAAASGCGDHNAGRPPVDALGADGSSADGSSADGSGADAAAVALDLPACQPVPPPDVLPAALPVVAGTRLIPRTLADPSAGGFEIPWAVHDTVLDADCEPVRFSDQKFRCVPFGISAWSARQQPVSRGFADAGRTAPVAVLQMAPPPPPGAELLTVQDVAGAWLPPDTMDSSCTPSDVTLWRVGAPRAERSYWNSDLTMVPVPAGYSLYDLAPLPAFVELEEVRAQLTGSIAIRELHGTDGSRIFSAGLYDTKHAVQVALHSDITDVPSDMARLLPPPAIALGAELFIKPPPSASAPGSSDSCVSFDVVFNVSSFSACDVSALPFISDLGGYEAPRFLPGIVHQVVKVDSALYSCQAPREHVPVPALAECAPSPLSDWTLASQVSVGGGRLTTPVWKIGDATLAPPYPFVPMFLREDTGRPRTFHDTALGVDCVPRSAADGALRCLPMQGGVAYSDAACTVPVAAYAFGGTTGTPLYVARGSFPSGDIQDGQFTIFSAGAPRSDVGLYHLDPDGACYRSDGFALFELGPEVPPASFAAFEIRDTPTQPGAGARPAAGTSAALRAHIAPTRRGTSQR